MSKIQVDAIEQQTACGTTLTAGGGAGKTVVVDATTVTLGRCGGTVALASGASQTGFGRTGTVDWQTGSIKTATFTAANGEGYFANTSGGAFTMNLPAGSAGAIVSVVDYTNTFQTNTLTISPNGSEKIGGVAAAFVASTEGQSLTFVYVDSTEGWKNVQDSTSNATGNPNLVATGGTVTTCGNFKIHTFTGPGTFTVSQVSITAAENTVGYQVVGGGGGANNGGGGGGGFREGRNAPIDNFAASPLVANAPTNAVTVTATSFPITVGAGGAVNTIGDVSTFSTITSAGGGRGAGGASEVGGTGGSGGGGGVQCGPAPSPSPTGGGAGGAGNTPPVSPSQGSNGGHGGGGYYYTGGGGGGAGATGSTGTTAGPGGSPTSGGNGGNGVSSSITGSSVTRAGGGGGMRWTQNPGTPGQGGAGGGGDAGAAGAAGTAGTVNTGGGGGGASSFCGPTASFPAAAGGSGIVIIRYKFQ
jgi:hypothetical protein